MPLTASELYQYDLTQELDLQKYYEIILERCYEEIKQTHYKQKKSQMIFHIPTAIAESTEYNFYACTRFIMESLREAGYFVRLINNKNIVYLYIAWRNKTKDERLKKDMKFFIKENYISQKELGLIKLKDKKVLMITDGNHRVKPSRVIKKI